MYLDYTYILRGVNKNRVFLGARLSKKANSSVKAKGSHLTIEDRAKIEYGLNHGHTIRSMARSLEKSPSTIKREIERNCTVLKDYANGCSKLKTINYPGDYDTLKSVLARNNAGDENIFACIEHKRAAD